VCIACVCSGFEVPSCTLSKPNSTRRIGLCTLAFGTESSSSIVLSAIPTISSSHSPKATTTSPAIQCQPSQSLDIAADGSLSIPEAICPGYPSAVDEDGISPSVDFPPADLPAYTTEFRIVVTHVDDEGHIYGHALSLGTNFSIDSL